jgi:hypothetical protein
MDPYHYFLLVSFAGECTVFLSFIADHELRYTWCLVQSLKNPFCDDSELAPARTSSFSHPE